MNSSQSLVDARSAAFSRLVARVVLVLNEAVETRKSEGETVTSIASELGWHKSALSRVLNGTTRNITLKTVSDVLWATQFDPKDFEADPIEELCPNWTGCVDATVVDGQFKVSFPLNHLRHHIEKRSVPTSNIKSFEIEQVAL